MNLLNQIAVSGLDHYEILHVVQAHYGTAPSTIDGDIVYPNSSDYALKLRCRAGKISAIERGPAFSDAEFTVIQGKIRTELAKAPGKVVERCILLSSKPVQGQVIL